MSFTANDSHRGDQLLGLQQLTHVLLPGRTDSTESTTGSGVGHQEKKNMNAHARLQQKRLLPHYDVNLALFFYLKIVESN